MSDFKAHIKEQLKTIPALPGIYKFYNTEGNIIYIGKSKCLNKRVKSYFTKNHKWEKVKKMVRLIDHIEYIVTDTHLEARLLECEQIKAIRPYFNSQMKNHDRYVYLKVSDYSPTHGNPLKIVTEREADSFGPFRSRYTLVDVIASFRNIYPILKEDNGYVFEYNLLPKTMNQALFLDNRNSLIEMFTDIKKLDSFCLCLEEKMKEAASIYKYETASMYRDILSGFQYIRYGINAYQNLSTQNILLKIPYNTGVKLIFVSDGLIQLKESFTSPSNEDMERFIQKGKEIASSHTECKTFSDLKLTEKMRIDFRDILYSEIMALPEEMVCIL